MSGEPGARETLFERVVLPHLDAGYSLARYLVRDAADAEDAVQEAVLRALRYLHTLKHEGDARAWFLAIVRRECFSARATAGSRVVTIPLGDAEPLQLTDTGISPEDSAQRALLVRRLATAVAELPDRLRETLVLREVQGCSYEEIAAITDAPIGTVMSRLSRARARLALLLGDAVDMGDLT